MTTGRRIETVTEGRKHGLIRRLISPQDPIGQRCKPFVFLDQIQGTLAEPFSFPMHPHSGIATLTYQLDCDVAYVDTEGRSGTLESQGLEWMQAGGGAWHRGTIHPIRGTANGFQLWVALPAGIESGPSYSQYVPPAEVPLAAGTRILMGSYLGQASKIAPPTPLNYLDVMLEAGQSWRFDPPPQHDVAWVMAYQGELVICGEVLSKALAVLGKTGPIEIVAMTTARFLVATAAHHPFDLFLGPSSVHTSEAALLKGLDQIRRTRPAA